MKDFKDIIRTYCLVKLGVGPDADVTLATEEVEIKKTLPNQLKVGFHLTKTADLNSWVHCECCLIDHFTQEPPGTNPTMVPYIGVSKLSCAACYAWTRASNEVNIAQYHTRGCHHRWYPSWAMPLQPAKSDLDKTKRDKALQHYTNKFVGEAYEKFVDPTGQKITIALSDSTVTKSDFPAVQWSMSESNKLFMMCIQHMQKRRDDAANLQQTLNTV